MIKNIFITRHCFLLSLTLIIFACSKGNSNDKKTAYVLNDTGITWSGNYPKSNAQECVSSNDKSHVSGQDCMHGRDLDVNDDSDGMAGFSYQKINADGEVLSSKAKAWACVNDNISGLMWESKVKDDGVFGNAGLHDADDQFTWYSSNRKNNTGSLGVWNTLGHDCAGYQKNDPKTYCHTEQFVSRVNKKSLCGYNDWRLPTRHELSGLVNFGRTEPAIEPQYFPHTHNSFYWSSTPKSARIDESWALSFQFGFVSPMRRADKHYVRLVRTQRVNTL